MYTTDISFAFDKCEILTFKSGRKFKTLVSNYSGVNFLSVFTCLITTPHSLEHFPVFLIFFEAMIIVQYDYYIDAVVPEST